MGSLAGELVAGKYQVLRALGQGSLGTVYLCQQTLDGRLAALKLPRPQLMASQVFRSQFWLELVAAGRLYAPNVVPNVEFGEDVALGTYYVAMPYVPQPDLATVLRGTSALPVERSADIIGQVLEALAGAHAAGIVHLNLKPSNVFVQLEGAAVPRVLVGDFGCSRLADPSGRIGTPAYASPEQALGRALDSRSDIYSVGVMLYELLAGQLPFEAESPFELARLHCGAPPPPPSGFRGIPPELEGVCLKALSKTPAARYQSAEEMRAAVAAASGRLAPAKRARRSARNLGPSEHAAPERYDTIPKRRAGLIVVIAAALACVGWASYAELAKLRSSAPHDVARSEPSPGPHVQLLVPEAGQELLPLTPTEAYAPDPGVPFGAAAQLGSRPEPSRAERAE